MQFCLVALLLICVFNASSSMSRGGGVNDLFDISSSSSSASINNNKTPHHIVDNNNVVFFSLVNTNNPTWKKADRLAGDVAGHIQKRMTVGWFGFESEIFIFIYSLLLFLLHNRESMFRLDPLRSLHVHDDYVDLRRGETSSAVPTAVLLHSSV